MDLVICSSVIKSIPPKIIDTTTYWNPTKYTYSMLHILLSVLYYPQQVSLRLKYNETYVSL